MTRYFFDLSDGQFIADEVGTEFTDLPAARRAAVDIVSDMLKGRGDQFWSGHEWELQCRDASGLRLFTLTFMGNDAPAVLGSKQPA